MDITDLTIEDKLNIIIDYFNIVNKIIDNYEQDSDSVDSEDEKNDEVSDAIHHAEANYNDELKKQIFLIAYHATNFQRKNHISFNRIEELWDLYLNNGILNYLTRAEEEALNYLKALDEIQNAVDDTFDMNKLFELFSIVMGNKGGNFTFRNYNTNISDNGCAPTDFSKIEEKVNDLFKIIDIFIGDDIKKAIYIHAEIAKIHPFTDGNGRTSKLVLNLFLLKCGSIPIYIPVEEKDYYFSLLDIFKREKNLEPLDQYIKHLIYRQFNDFFLNTDDMSCDEIIETFYEEEDDEDYD